MYVCMWRLIWSSSSSSSYLTFMQVTLCRIVIDLTLFFIGIGIYVLFLVHSSTNGCYRNRTVWQYYRVPWNSIINYNVIHTYICINSCVHIQNQGYFSESVESSDSVILHYLSSSTTVMCPHYSIHYCYHSSSSSSYTYIFDVHSFLF